MSNAPMGNSDVAAILSWRAIPLQPSSLTLWQKALRASQSVYSILRLHGVALGILFKLGSNPGLPLPPRVRVVLDANGAMVFEGPDVKLEPLVWEDDGGNYKQSLPRGLWADLYRILLYGVPRVSNVDADPPALDQVIALHESGVQWDDPRVISDARDHYVASRLFQIHDRHGGSYLCGHVDFRRLAGFSPYSTALCGDDAVISIL
jgi:hypothetical protein